MLEMRFHGRGGQGTVRGCQVLAKALVRSGGHAQFIPAFGVERKGSPVYGYFRLDDSKIRCNAQVYHPGVVVIADDSLIASVPVYDGLSGDKLVLVNTVLPPAELRAPADATLATVDATGIAMRLLGVDIPNTVMLGGLARLLPLIDKEALRAEVGRAFGDKNVAAFDAGYEQTLVQKETT